MARQRGGKCRDTYEEIDVEVAAAAKLTVRDLEGYGHFVVFVQLLMEALARVGAHLDVVREGGAEGGEEDAGREGREEHRGWDEQVGPQV